MKEIGERGEGGCAAAYAAPEPEPVVVPVPVVAPAARVAPVVAPAAAVPRAAAAVVSAVKSPVSKKLPPQVPGRMKKQEMPEQDDDGLNPLQRTHLDLVAGNVGDFFCYFLDLIQEEEVFVSHHRLQIDEMVKLIKEEMALLAEVEKPGASMDNYVATLSRVLERKMDVIKKLHKRLNVFKDGLDQEEKLSRSLDSKDMPNEDYCIHREQYEDDDDDDEPSKVVDLASSDTDE